MIKTTNQSIICFTSGQVEKSPKSLQKENHITFYFYFEERFISRVEMRVEGRMLSNAQDQHSIHAGDIHIQIKKKTLKRSFQNTLLISSSMHCNSKQSCTYTRFTECLLLFPSGVSFSCTLIETMLVPQQGLEFPLPESQSRLSLKHGFWYLGEKKRRR